ncbi:MAG: metal-dependent hydrolase [Myxococcota bacterium]
MEATPTVTKPQIRPRNTRIGFSDAIAKHWFGGSAVATHLINGVNLLFPEGERFFVRSVRAYLDEVTPERRDEVVAFFRQEGSHAREHERYFAILEAQGYEIRPFLEDFKRILRRVERMSPPQLRLAVTAATEHFTAVMAENAFIDRRMFDESDPVMRDLLLWHAAEEIEHKAVAYDVLQEVAPAYLWRLLGLLVAAGMLSYFWSRATQMLLRQDGLRKEDADRDIEAFQRWRGTLGIQERDIGRDVFWRGIKEYLRPSFHPWQNNNAHLIADFLAALDGSSAEPG